jgi:hypothetical protein
LCDTGICPTELRPIPPTARDHVAGPITRPATRGPTTYLPLSRCSSTSAGRSYTKRTTSTSRIILTGLGGYHRPPLHRFPPPTSTYLPLFFFDCISWLSQQTTSALLATRDFFCHAFAFGYRMIPTWLYTLDSCHGQFRLGIHYSGLWGTVR